MVPSERHPAPPVGRRGDESGNAMPEQQILDIVADALGPNAPLTLEQLSALLMVLAIATVLLAAGLGYQIARAEKRIKSLEAALAAGDRAAKEAM